MCIAPNTLLDGTATACHSCWQCREQAINDWVGRCTAESYTALDCHAVTLTYGRDDGGDSDHPHAALLIYSDVKKYLKLLRRHGFIVRYFVTGEYGGKKGRAHWHIMLYWVRRSPTGDGEADRALREKWFPGGTAWRNDPETGKWVSKPWAAGDIPVDWNFIDEKHWPHGFSFWTRPTHGAIRYNTKYIQKDLSDAQRQGHLAMSKKPPLGAAYFERLADQYVRQGLAPQSLEYTFADVRRRRKDGTEELQPFRLANRSAELFLQRFVDRWAEHWPERPIPASEVVADFLDGDKLAKEAARILERRKGFPAPSAMTAAQRIQFKYDAERLVQIGQVKRREEKFAKLGVPVVGRPVVDRRRGPSDLAEWEERFEEYYGEKDQGGAAQRQEQRARLLRLQAEVFRTIGAVWERAGEYHAAARAYQDATDAEAEAASEETR